MGNPKQKWRSEEEEALKAGVAKHGAGKWKNIQKDPQFNHLLFSRSNIDLKDKWRNMSVANGQFSRDKSRSLKPKANPDAPATPLLLTYPSSSTAPVENDGSTDAVHPVNTVNDDSTRCILDGKTASKYNIMIYEALSTMKDPNGSDISSVVKFIEQRHEVPPNFRKLLSGRLRRLVGQGRLEKALNGYRITRDILPAVKAEPISNVAVHPLRQPQTYRQYLGNEVTRAAAAAAYCIAEAENKAFVAAEAMKEAERVAEMAEEAESFLQLAKEISDRCSCGEVVSLA